MSTAACCRHDEAHAFIESIADRRMKAALTYALTTVAGRRNMNPEVSASAPFDLRFFLEVVHSMFVNQPVIDALADGTYAKYYWD